MNPRQRYWLFLGIEIILGLLWIFPCVLQAQNQKDYLMGPEDVIDITVWGHDDLKRVLPISLEGTITFPLIGEVKAIGKSTQELEKEMAVKLGDGYLIKPQITISVKEYNSQKIFVMGEVNKPGTYPITKENNLVYLLSQAGGPTKDAGEEVVIIRPNKPHSKGMTLEEAEAKKVPVITVNLKEAMAGDHKHNVSIRNGDSIIVSKIHFFFVMGEVRNPGKYNLERGTNVLTGISIGGGLKDAGEEVVIIRPNNPHSSSMTLEEAEAKKVPIITLNLNDVLTGDPKHNISIRNGDSIIVSKIPFFFVMGEVKYPGKHNLERGTTVLTGISMGGGLTAKAAPGRTKIVREKDGKKIEMKVTMGTPVQPGDTIIVPESFF